MFELSVFLRDRLLGRSTFTQEEVRLGRSADCEVQIDNLAVSRYHASVEAANGVHFLKDFGSQLGTVVNGQRVRGRCGLGDGDRIGIGKYTVLFRCDRPKAEARAEVRDEASYALAGSTLVLAHGASDARERTCPFVGHLELLRDRDALVPRTVPLARDLTLIGSAPGCDLRWGEAPERAAVIARCWTGFALVSLSAVVKRNGQPIATRTELANGDRLQFGPVACRFLVAQPEAGP